MVSPNPNTAPAIVVGTILLTLFASWAVSGLVFIYDHEWCQPGVFCAEAWKMLRVVLECAVIASMSATICAWSVRARLARMHTSVLPIIGCVCSVVLYLTLNTDALYLLNYDSLTMAAQFGDYRLPDKETSNYKIPLPRGSYKFRVVQLVDPKSRWRETIGEGPAFLLEYELSAEISKRFETVPWAKF